MQRSVAAPATATTSSTPRRSGSRNLTESTGAGAIYCALSAPSIPLN